jgi:hypothetical protein
MMLQNSNSLGYASIRYQTDTTNYYAGVGCSGTGTYANKFYIVSPNGNAISMNSIGNVNIDSSLACPTITSTNCTITNGTFANIALNNV